MPDADTGPPDRPWAMSMRWHDLLFAHWPVDPALLRPLVPGGLEIETFDGAAWLGVVPFRMSHVRHRLLPPVPGLSAFPELNVRTYVRPAGGGRPGVWFFSLDAANRAAVIAARGAFNLPYMDAAMRCERDGEWVRYASRRTGPRTSLVFGGTRSRSAELVARYRPIGPAFRARPGTLEHFLTDRLCLYALRRRGGIARLDIDHEPWPLHAAEWDPERNTMGEQLGISAPNLAGAPRLHFAQQLDVRAWLPRTVVVIPAARA